MATPSKIVLSASQRPEFRVANISDASAARVSELLQENHEKYHIFFNESRFHNHIVHHLLTIYALGASPAELTKAYEINADYQRPMPKLEEGVVQQMHEPVKFKECLGKQAFFRDFLVFFQQEMEKKGWEAVVNEYLFKGDERAEDLFGRLFAGLLHPLIHLGFGIEFEQPAIIAEALSQAAVHENWVSPLLLACEKAAKGNSGPGKSLVEIIDEARQDDVLVKSVQWDDDNKLRDGIMVRTLDRMARLAGQWSVKENELEDKTAEMINTVFYFTAGSQHPPKAIKYDFIFIHQTNSSIFFSRFLKLPFLSAKSKARILEWKAWSDLAVYVARGSPEPLVGEINAYASPEDKSWIDIFERINRYQDDGHAAKLIRALAHGKEVSAKFETSDAFRVKGEMWDKMANMAIDSVEAGGPRWVRNSGFAEAWTEVPERQARL